MEDDDLDSVMIILTLFRVSLATPSRGRGLIYQPLLSSEQLAQKTRNLTDIKGAISYIQYHKEDCVLMMMSSESAFFKGFSEH